MITGISIDEKKEFIPESERNSDNPTKFIIRGLTTYDMLAITAGDGDKIIETKKTAQSFFPTVIRGTVEIKNICLKEGEAAKDITEITEDVINAIPFNIVTELFAEIMAASKISPDEEKN